MSNRPSLPPTVLATLLAVFCAGCSSVGLPSIGGGPSEVDRVFLLAAGNWDRNRDGIVTCDEWKAYAAELFDGADSGRKGHLTKADWDGVTKVDKMFETVAFTYYDRNSDGRVDRAEMVDRPSRAFEMADRDKNCQMTTLELSAARTAGSQAPASAVTPPPDPSEQRRPGR
jgi:hypothetical protein